MPREWSSRSVTISLRPIPPHRCNGTIPAPKPARIPQTGDVLTLISCYAGICNSIKAGAADRYPERSSRSGMKLSTLMAWMICSASILAPACAHDVKPALEPVYTGSCENDIEHLDEHFEFWNGWTPWSGSDALWIRCRRSHFSPGSRLLYESSKAMPDQWPYADGVQR